MRTKLDIPIHTQQNIITLDVPMDHAVSVKVLEPLTRLTRDSGNLALRHEIGGDHIGQRAALHVLHDDPEVVLVEE